jgi:hypothetical protein
MPDVAAHLRPLSFVAERGKRVPRPGDVVPCILPSNPPREDGRLPDAALIVDIDLQNYEVPIFIMTPVVPEENLRGDVTRMFFRRVGEIRPLNRVGHEVIRLWDFNMVPLTPAHFPELDKRSPKAEDVQLTILGSIAPDWLAIIRADAPHPNDYKKELLADICKSFSGIQREIEDEFERQFHAAGELAAERVLPPDVMASGYVRGSARRGIERQFEAIRDNPHGVPTRYGICRRPVDPP